MINIDINKYENNVIKNIDKNNFNKIISFLISKNCDYIEDLLEDYLDLFIIEYDDFIIRFNKLDEKYNHNIINEIKENMNILEEFYF